MSVPMPTGAVRAHAATLWAAFTVAAHLATSCRVMEEPAKVGPVCYSTLPWERMVGAGASPSWN